ncbi:5-hydroxytryptamine receptor 3A [Labeo rohita]|uniref:5-hydroxytryptamine receptor 3A n=1 Tax=Labeo rohita TaxID=84645 RepID=A0ABQ8LL25_LABRO|nr:5-hydroxytryptamine receptor 3A [Labeo rohita]
MSPVFLLSLLLSVIPQAELVPEKPKRSALNQLTRLLLRKYNSGVRPVQNWTKPTTVYIDLIIQSVLDVDGQMQKVTTSIWYRQIWNDEFLVWDPEEFDGITEISLSSDAIWVPDVIINEFVDVGKSPVIPYVYVNCSGTVKNYKPIQVVSACHLEIYAFPFDKQNCTLTFRSWLHSVNEVDLALWRPAEEITNDTREFMNDGEWELLERAFNSSLSVSLKVLIRRRPLLYVVSLLIPSIFFMVVDVTSFYLPPNSGTRITFKTSILLGYTVIRVNLMDEIPATAIKTPLIGAFFAVCMALLVLSLAMSIFVVKLLHYSEKEVKEMSISACLLDKYGSMDQSFIESAFTSMKTLDDMEQSGEEGGWTKCCNDTAQALMESSEITNGAQGASLEGSSPRLEACEKNPEQRQTAQHHEMFSTLDSSLRLHVWGGGDLLSKSDKWLFFCLGAVKKLGNNTGRFANATLVRLNEFLSAGYKKGVRPVRDWRQSTTVAIDLMVYAILNVQWIDEFLAWDPEEFDNVKQISIPTANIWVPDILINEFVDVGKSPEIPYVYVGHTGLVRNYKPIQVVTACSLNIYNFPYDVQKCSLTFQSWLHTTKDINITLMRTPEEVMNDKSVFMNQGEWELLHVLSTYKEFSIDNDDYYAEMKFHVVIRRRPLFYTVNLLLPSVFLMVMDIVGFYLPPDSGERVSFKITLLLGYSVFLIIVSDTLPATAIGTPLIGVYFVVCMALLVISLTESVLIVRLVHKQDLQSRVPHCEGSRDSGRNLGLGLSTRDSASPVMDGILREITTIRQFLEKKDESREIAKEWLQVGYVLDVLLFRVYLLTVLAYSITLGTLWSVWQNV